MSTIVNHQALNSVRCRSQELTLLRPTGLTLEEEADVSHHTVRLHVAVVGTRVGETCRSNLAKLSFHTEANVEEVFKLFALQLRNRRATEGEHCVSLCIAKETIPRQITL